MMTGPCLRLAADIVTVECVAKNLEVTDEALPPSYFSMSNVVEPSPVTGTIAYSGETGKPPKRPAKKRRLLKKLTAEEVAALHTSASASAAGGGRGKAPAAASSAAADASEDEEDGEDGGAGGAGGDGDDDDAAADASASMPCKCAFDGVNASTIAAATMDTVEGVLQRLVLPKLPPLDEGPVYVRQAPTIRSHTSFLTFATLWVKTAPAK